MEHSGGYRPSDRAACENPTRGPPLLQLIPRRNE